MHMIDTHAHVYLDEFKSDLGAVIDRAKEKGISRILMPAINSETHDLMLETERQYPQNCISMMGLHPCSVKGNYREELRLVTDNLAKRRFVAVGEIGLDFYWDTTFKEEQLDAFHQQVELALHYDIPIVIHSRQATDECIDLVKDHQKGKLKGVFHCFSGSADQASRIIDLGLYLGIGGVLTYKNSGLDEVCRLVDPNYLVLETDAPYLSPVPFRGKRNESSYLIYIVQKLADARQMAVQEITEVTTRNAENLFGL